MNLGYLEVPMPEKRVWRHYVIMKALDNYSIFSTDSIEEIHRNPHTVWVSKEEAEKLFQGMIWRSV